MTCIFSYNDRIYDSVYTRNNTGQRKPVFSHILAVFGLNNNLCNKLMVSEIYCSCSYVSWIVFFLKNSFFLKKSFFSKINLVWYDETLFWENVFFLSRFSFADTGDSQESMGRKRNIFYSSLSTTRSRTFRHLFTTLHMR